MKHFGSYRSDRIVNAKIRYRDNLTVYLIEKREEIVKRGTYRLTSLIDGAVRRGIVLRREVSAQRGAAALRGEIVRADRIRRERWR